MTLMRHMYGLADIPLAYNTGSRGFSESNTIADDAASSQRYLTSMASNNWLLLVSPSE